MKLKLCIALTNPKIIVHPFFLLAVGESSLNRGALISLSSATSSRCSSEVPRHSQLSRLSQALKEIISLEYPGLALRSPSGADPGQMPTPLANEILLQVCLQGRPWCPCSRWRYLNPRYALF